MGIRGVDYIGVGVGAAIFDAQGRLFLMLRGPEAKNERGRWEIPGGAVEYGETVTDALVREIREECGVTVEPVELLNVADHLLPDERQHWVSPTYICRIVGGEPAIMEPGKCDAIGWFMLAETEHMPISVVTASDIAVIRKKYPDGYRTR